MRAARIEVLFESTGSMSDPDREAFARHVEGLLRRPSREVWLSWISTWGRARRAVEAKGSSGSLTFSASVRSENDCPDEDLEREAFAETYPFPRNRRKSKDG